MPSDLYYPRNATPLPSSKSGLLQPVLQLLGRAYPRRRHRPLSRPYSFRSRYLGTRLILPAGIVSASFLCFLLVCHLLTHQTQDLIASPSSNAARHQAAAASATWLTLPDISELKRTIRPSVQSLSPFSRQSPMSETERAEMQDGVEALMDELKSNWPSEHWCTARTQTLEELEKLRDCLEEGTCGKNQASVIIGGSYHFGNSIGGHTSGEDIWARSSMESFRAMGHTVIYAYQPLEMLTMYNLLGASHVPLLIMESDDISRCVQLGVPRVLTSDEAANKKEFHVCPSGELDRLRTEHGLSRPEDHELRRDGREVDELGRVISHGWKKTHGDDKLGADQLGCVMRDGFEHGIPIWKMFALHFWGGSAHPLGNQWTLSPEDYRDPNPQADPTKQNYYLGYSIEAACKTQTFTPADQRQNRAFVYGKTPDYLSQNQFAFYSDNRTFSDLKEKLDTEFVVAMGNAREVSLPDLGVTNIGSQTKEAFLEAIGRSKVMLGLGRPWTSPTPYESLCMGTPFINPVIEFDPSNPSDKSKWTSQQDALKHVPEPYVYHVHAHDLDGLERAIKTAMANPLKERYVPPWMTEKATKRRHWELVHGGWEGKAEKRMEVMRVELGNVSGADVWGLGSLIA